MTLLTKLKKNSINITNNVNLISNTYTFLVFKLLLRIVMLLDSFDHVRRVTSVDGANGNGKDLESASLEVRKTIMEPKWLTYGMSKNLPRHAPK